MNIQHKNLGTVNANSVTINGIEIIFSYETPVAFRFKGERIARINDWSTTTGKLINKYEPDKNKRLASDEFERLLNEAVTCQN